MLLLLACAIEAFQPACVAAGSVHACGLEIAHGCNLMYVQDGLRVRFSGATAAEYEVSLRVDGGAPLGFRCGKAGPEDAELLVQSCDAEGFLVDVEGDGVEVTVTLPDGRIVEETFAPCWTVSEPNGRCCGFHYDAEVELDLAI